MCHRDFAYYNIVFGDGEPRALIDFDLVGPGSRVRDFSYFAYRAVPLCSPQSATSGGWGQPLHVERRLRLAADTYRLGENDRLEVVDEACTWLSSAIEHLEARIAAGDPAYAQHASEGHVEVYRSDLDHLQASANDLTAALVRTNWPMTRRREHSSIGEKAITQPLRGRRVTMSDAPVGSGLGGSGAFLVALMHSLAGGCADDDDARVRLAESAASVEIVDLRRSVGR